jgi:hypothetical protein
MSGGRFKYALQPVLLTRQWALDALMLTLSEHNAAVAEHAALEAAVLASHQSASDEWRAAVAGGQEQSVQQFAMSARYLGDLGRQLREHAVRGAELAAARDDVIAQVVAARRAVEAAEEHRDEMKDQFIQKRLSADFKVADDQWNTMQTGADSNGN